MNIITKIFRGEIQRKTRAHSEKGILGFGEAVDLLDSARSFLGHLSRLVTRRNPRLPWLTYGSIRYLKCALPPDARVFEFGGGMSTLWFENRFAEVHTVEDNPQWYHKLRNAVHNAKVSFCQDEAYVRSIEQFPKNYFDLIVVDGIPDRMSCFHCAEPYLKRGGLFVIDDTDKFQQTGAPLRELDRWLETCDKYRIRRFTGWVPGSFWVKETTIARKLD